jgi:hypothetical protein
MGLPMSVTELTVLTVRQPWASLLLSGEDWCENRRWHTDHRGPLWIHSSTTVDFAACERLQIAPAPLVTGAILGVLDLVTVLPLADLRAQQLALATRWNLNVTAGARFVQGPYCWIVAQPRRLAQPIRARGALYLWRQRVAPNALSGWTTASPLLPPNAATATLVPSSVSPPGSPPAAVAEAAIPDALLPSRERATPVPGEMPRRGSPVPR